jgi:hypothetical protein
MLRIQVTRRLISQDDLRLMDDRPRNRHALLLSTRQLARPVLDPMHHPDETQHLRDSFSHYAPLFTAQQQREGDIFFHCETGDQMKGLKNNPD